MTPCLDDVPDAASEGPDLSAVEAHYSLARLDATVREALAAAGLGEGTLTPDDLAPLDQFHVGGKEATLSLARLADVRSGESVLDVGGGLGGPARVLAHEFGCAVTVLDPADAYVRLGAWLTTRTGLGDRVAFVRGSGTALPFADARFDVVWTQHSGMNIADKERLSREIRRVLRPSGRLVLEEMTTGPRLPLRFPVPFAPDQSLSFLKPPAAVRQVLAGTGFRELAWEDVTAAVLDAIAAPSPRPGGACPLSVRLLLGADASPALDNLVRNLAEGRLLVSRGLLARD